ncbi:transmembrane protein, putative (macronuclear) [Tetrahymena thermophila SB210]|uniref:Transmembrane protein, putative n=1 Tax=Tetrahymena thermophila (strain SB210) TaxID=312017 RepID=Q247R3_TETTS|nr:transmembrane protein, putative [Tetrahymena thermophila SB210]EAS04037.2 transmembrane protein, putative [Tetrahymena thermophila SB210]|eukprot:XP_001024282.2 transmembrane protein, putative [Tetrahymena thermophila SB210]
MTNFVTKSFAKFDIFGSEVGLNYQKDSIFKTTFGGFMSLSFFAFLGIFFWSSIFSFLNRENVIATTNKQFYTDPPVVTLNAKNFMFAVQIGQKNFLENPYLNISFETRNYITLKNGTKIRNLYPTQLEPCTPEHWSQLPQYEVNWTEQFYRFNFQQFLCPTKDYQFQLGGSYNSENFYHWKFSIVKCSNNTLPTALWKPVCKSDEEVEQYFNKTQNIRFNIYTSNYVINALESKNYVNNFIEDSMFFQIQKKNSYITSDIYLSENIIQTDQSLLPFPSITNQTIITFESGNYRPQYIFGQIGDVYADFFIRKDAFVYSKNRAFQKISQIISYIGGFAQIFILVTSILVNYYNEYVYAISLANKIYDFQFSKKKINKSKQTQKIISQNVNDTKRDDDGSGKQCKVDGQFQINFQDIKTENKQPSLTEQLDLENQETIRGCQEQFVDIYFKKEKSQKVTLREDDGLLPLDQLKEIIFLRKQQMEKQQQNQLFQKQSTLNQKNQLIKTEEQIELEEEEEDEVENFNQVQSNLNRKKQNSNQQQIQKMKETSDNIQNMLGYDQQGSAHKIEQKIIMNESIYPDNPLDNQAKTSQDNNDLKKDIKVIETENINEGIQEKEQEFKEIYQRQQSNLMARQVESIQNLNQNDAATSENAQMISNQTFNKINTPSNNLAKETPKSKYHSQNNLLLHGLGYKNQKQFLSREFEFLLKKQVTLSMTFKYFLYKLTCHKFFKTEQVLLLDKANKQMKQDLDILNIMNRLKEIEKFKKLFLDKNQEILFNFFPKPVISVENDEHNLTRAEIEEQVKKNIKRDSQSNINLMKSLKINEKQQKKLKINIKLASVIQKAAMKFKKPLISKVNQQNSISTYNILYDAYEKLIVEGQNSQFNKKLINLLGDELSNIFEISTLLANKAKIIQKQNLSQIMLQDKEKQLEFVDLESK